jgi:hypothetical protein
MPVSLAPMPRKIAGSLPEVAGLHPRGQLDAGLKYTVLYAPLCAPETFAAVRKRVPDGQQLGLCVAERVAPELLGTQFAPQDAKHSP